MSDEFYKTPNLSRIDEQEESPEIPVVRSSSTSPYEVREMEQACIDKLEISIILLPFYHIFIFYHSHLMKLHSGLLLMTILSVLLAQVDFQLELL